MDAHDCFLQNLPEKIDLSNSGAENRCFYKKIQKTGINRKLRQLFEEQSGNGVYLMLDMSHETMVRRTTDEDVIKKFKKEKLWGLVVNVNLKECNLKTIRDPEKIKEFVIKFCDFIDMNRFGEPTIVNFGQDARVAGFSMTQLIETSLISGHFANETNAAYLDLFSCKEYPQEKTARFCKEFFEAKSMTYTISLRK
jgi:S-adenosylmethionine/arginine decarboxylase-like enzyme